MSIQETARAIYIALQNDTAALAEIRTARATLAASLATDPNGSMAVTSATMNGQTFSGMVSLKPVQRLAVLSRVCQMADNGTAISSMTQPYL